MIRKSLFISAIAVLGATSFTACTDTTPAKVEEALTPVPFQQVTLEDEFWLPRLKTQKKTLVPFSLEKTEPAVENLRRTGAFLRGEKIEPLLKWPYYVASDLFKVMEGAAYLLTLEKDPELERQMDEIIDVIAAAQKEDGYLYEHHTVAEKYRNPNNNGGAGTRPYQHVAHSHELYNMGHMYEGAIAYYQATGKRKWLDVAEKSARHINKVFFEGDPNYNDGKPVMTSPGHEEIELALVKMFRVTGDSLYLNMAKKFIDIRGVGADKRDNNYAQQHLPVREQRTAVGHSVRATYLYSGMADVAAMTGDESLKPALEAIWHDIVDKKMHITGGLGAVPGIEGFGPDYLLPNKDTYDETCSAVGNVFFNHRMFLMSGDAKYVDVAEVALYNNVLAGVNLEGNRFFYVNPLEADGRKAFNHGHLGRSPWFSTACCPSNLARLIPQISGMIYSHTDDDIFCALYAGSSTEIPLAAGAVKISQKTEYPFEGNVTFELTPANDGEEFTLWLRIPSWCQSDRFVSGDLYRFTDGAKQNAVAKVNGRKVRSNIVDGYLPISRKWSAGDKVELSLPMPVRYNVADERVKADSNRVCVTRGPLVFCAETADNEHQVSTYFISEAAQKSAKVAEFTDGIMKGIPTISIAAHAASEEASAAATLTLVPYYAWDNRGDKAMNVWFGRDAETARTSLVHTVGNIKDVSATHTFSGDDVYAIADGKRPSSSADRSITRWTSWPEKGKKQQVEVILKKAQPIESVSVYWYDDKGGVQPPVEWSMEYRSEGKWHKYTPYITDSYGVAINQFNMVHPASAITADALRLNITPRKDSTAGILELVVE